MGGEHILCGASCACLLYFLLHGRRGGNDLVAYQASILIYHNPDHNSNPGPETSSAGVSWDRCVWKGSSCCAGTCKELRPRGQTYVESILPHPRDIFCSPIWPHVDIHTIFGAFVPVTSSNYIFSFFLTFVLSVFRFFLSNVSGLLTLTLTQTLSRVRWHGIAFPTWAAPRRIPDTNGYPLRTGAITPCGKRVPGEFCGYAVRNGGTRECFTMGICEGTRFTRSDFIPEVAVISLPNLYK